jgi:dihydroxyacid dehydratase/phosphogluconate dehydratase
VTRKSLENAIASVAATGGSTNGVLHLLAIAHEFGIPLELDEFGVIADRTPIVADMRPGGRYTAADMYNAGGIGLVMRELLKKDLLHGEEKTIDGRTIARIAAAAVETEGQKVVVTASIGGAVGRAEALDVLVRFADDALYQAKAAGRNQHVTHPDVRPDHDRALTTSCRVDPPLAPRTRLHPLARLTIRPADRTHSA